jgi:hypothetical protein
MHAFSATQHLRVKPCMSITGDETAKHWLYCMSEDGATVSCMHPVSPDEGPMQRIVTATSGVDGHIGSYPDWYICSLELQMLLCPGTGTSRHGFRSNCVQRN